MEGRNNRGGNRFNSRGGSSDRSESNDDNRGNGNSEGNGNSRGDSNEGNGNSRGNSRGNGGNRRRGRGGNGGSSRGGRGRSNNNNSNNSGGRGRYNRSGNHSGNARERIAVESGYLVIIDQFMLANPQFQTQLLELIEQDPEEKNTLIESFGGVVTELEPGNYKILRNPYANRIVIHESKSEEMDYEEIIATAEKSIGKVLIDTRCLAMIDRELLDDTELLAKYQELWFSDQDKACRDLLRDNGGAVRYGFKRFGDELDVYHVAAENTICLAAKEVAEEAASEESAKQSDAGEANGNVADPATA